jgi:hypothetical protein
MTKMKKDTRNYGKDHPRFSRGGAVDPSDMGPDSKEDPPPTQEIEEWREELQRQKGNPVDAPIGPNDKDVDPVRPGLSGGKGTGKGGVDTQFAEGGSTPRAPVGADPALPGRTAIGGENRQRQNYSKAPG